MNGEGEVSIITRGKKAERFLRRASRGRKGINHAVIIIALEKKTRIKEKKSESMYPTSKRCPVYAV